MGKYSYLWTEDRGEFMETFLKYNHIPTQEEIEEAGDEGLHESPPTLDQFKEQVRGLKLCSITHPFLKIPSF